MVGYRKMMQTPARQGFFMRGKANLSFCPHSLHGEEQSAISSQRSAFTRLHGPHGIAHQMKGGEWRVAGGGTKADR